MATVLQGIQNIYTVKHGGENIECVIKGKILKGTGRSYAPLAPGDEVELDRADSGFSRIISRRSRRSEFSRLNKKRMQTLAANADLVICVSSPGAPPFRPRFIDRIQVTCGFESLSFMVVMNKSDLPIPAEVEERLDIFSSNDISVIRCSAATSENVDTLADIIAGKKCVFCGQSGVGKTSLLNCLFPGLNLKVGAISIKNNRGTHTTRFGILFDNPRGGWVVDTPGIREFELVDIQPADLSFYFPEMVNPRKDCSVPGCTHDHEPGCAVRNAVEEEVIHSDRYDSYLRILDSLKMREELYG